MEINQNIKDGVCQLVLTGRLDTVTSPQLEEKINEALEKGVTGLDFDFKQLEYISSAGLRVLLRAQKSMAERGEMCIRNVSDELMEVFEMTGFVDILKIC